ncbi:MAG TPA: AtpZ/AtpI family protein [Polyangiaceae bacterium]|nr:AtpZ/AtpI family protein [Polyangiaceae bacterium]
MKAWKELGRYGGIGIELVLTILLLGWAGNYLDRRYLGAHGWGLAVGFLLGVLVAVRNLVRTARRMQRDIERAEAQDPEAGRWTVDESWLHKDPPADVTRDSVPEQTPQGDKRETRDEGSSRR